jgi:Spy/CpxP family protein refolding chaperone
MRTRGLLAVHAAAWTFAAASARADSLDLKLGLWETTFTTNVSGTLVPEAELQKMPSAQRQQIEAMLKKQQAAGPRTRTTKTCLTKERLGRAFEKAEADEEKNCKRTVLVATPSRQEVTIACTGERPQTKEWRMEATSPESAKGNVKVVSGSGSVTMSFTARWVASGCGTGD